MDGRASRRPARWRSSASGCRAVLPDTPRLFRSGFSSRSPSAGVRRQDKDGDLAGRAKTSGCLRHFSCSSPSP
jgi:hypothetical protein